MTSAGRVLAIVPARGGSKGIPGKNLIEVAGRSLLARAVGAGLRAASVDDVVVSTDDEAIAEAGRRAGALVPFIRPAQLAGDKTPTAPVILHAIHWLSKELARTYEYFVLLQPTAPFRTHEDVDEAVRALRGHPAARSLVSLVRVDEPHPWKMKVLEDGFVRPLMNTKEPNVAVRRQDCPPVYALNGAIYIARVEDLLTRGEILTDPVLPFEMPASRSVNIDSHLDLALARHLADDGSNE